MATAVQLLLLRLALLSLFLFLVLFPTTHSISDSEALLKLKTSLTNTDSLDSWVAESAPCSRDVPWEGLICYDGIVMGLRLEGIGLSGNIDIDSLFELKGLRTISFMNNSFSGPIPEFNRLGTLKAIYLSMNQFSGEIPSDYFAKTESLKKIWVSDNKFTGEIPSSLAQLSNLMELHLENNQFTGNIPIIDQPTLISLNISNNRLEGEIPSSLSSKFNASIFAGNADLCSEKLGKACPIEENELPITSINDTRSNKSNGSESINNEALRSNNIDTELDSFNDADRSKKIIAAAVTFGMVVLSISIILFARSKRKVDDFDEMGDQSAEEPPVQVFVAEPETIKKEVVVVEPSVLTRMVNSSSGRRGSNHVRGGGLGDLTMLNDEKGTFGLTNLMKAAAEVLGNGGSGSSYKAVMANGMAVVVKRMREMNAMGREGFDIEIKRLGGLRHWNILTPLAYHYRRDEKLVVYEYIPKGSLLYLLHGDHGPTHAGFDWPARLKIVQGVAKGLQFLHTELAHLDLPHGNLKSSNVLLGPDFQPLLADYGFSPLINRANVTQALFAYKAPEAAQFGKVSPKSDVYCFGIIILEILTGKYPCQYINNGKGGIDIVQWVASAISDGRESELLDPEIAGSKDSLTEIEQLLHIGAACTEKNADERLNMKEAIRRIEDIPIEGG